MLSGGTKTDVGSVKDDVLPAAEGSISIRIYRPQKPASRGTVLFIHGGAFIAGAIQSHGNMARLICSTSETNVVSVEYTRAPAAKVRATLADGTSREGWISCGSPETMPAYLMLSDTEAILMSSPRPKKFESTLEIDGKTMDVGVNKPLHVRGWDVYQYSYDEKLGSASQYSVVELVQDRGLHVALLCRSQACSCQNLVVPDFPDAPSRREVLQKSQLLSALTESQLQELAGSSRMAHAAKNEVIWISGQSVDFFGIVGAGFIKMTTTGPGHQDITTEIMGPGQVFGLLGVLDGTGCPQSAKAIVDTWYLKVRKADFLPTYESNIVLKEHIFRRTTLRLRQSFDLIAQLSIGTVEQRVAAILLVLARSFGQEHDEGILLDVPLTRQEISELAGTTVESTIRIMSRWQKQGWVETQARHVFVKDFESLLNAVR